MSNRGKELLEHGLKDMYDAEHRFVDALETMIAKASDDELVKGFRRHQKVTKEQIRRLERAFDAIGSKPKREDCPGSKGLVAEYQKFVKEEKPDAETLDAFSAEAGLKVEHYEIVSYRSLINLAQFLGYDACVDQLKRNLVEEEQAAAELQTQSTRLSAELTGGSEFDVARSTGRAMFDQVREGTFVAAHTAVATGARAARRGRKAVDSARERGRASRTGKAKTGSRARSTARRATSTAKRKASSAKTAARKTAARGRKATRSSTSRRKASSRS